MYTRRATPVAAMDRIAAVIVGLSVKNSKRLEPESSSFASYKSASVRPHYGSLHVISIESTASVISLYMADISLYTLMLSSLASVCPSMDLFSPLSGICRSIFD